ncbi:MAG TPA: HRDC domain-containing protein [Kofleriaceae bacterium]|nr:HRDC domain-containing protein [Kofleriaceae bacterium]
MSTTVVADVDANAVAAIAASLSAAPLVAFDLEFLAQDRLVPTLCLVQVAWLEHIRLDAPVAAIVASPPMVRLVDPLAVDVGPIAAALAAHPCAVAHAPRQDLAILAQRFGVAMPAIVDTQAMAAFAGMGDQIGFAALANELLGLSLGKELQWTNWAARPLSDAQLAYADADVRHLPAIYAKLAARLGERMAWVRAESSAMAAEAVEAANVTPETAWRNLGGLRGLDAPALAAAIDLAAWRQRTCIELDRPLGQVLTDKALLDLARQRPSSVAAIRGTKGVSPMARQRADQIAEVIAAIHPDAVAPIAAGRPLSPRAQRWTDVLLAIVQLVAEQSGIPPRLLATRSDAEELARTVDERGIDATAALPSMSTWRREVLGAVWARWLAGELALVGDLAAPHGLRLVPR